MLDSEWNNRLEPIFTYGAVQEHWGGEQDGLGTSLEVTTTRPSTAELETGWAKTGDLRVCLAWWLHLAEQVADLAELGQSCCRGDLSFAAEDVV